MRGGKRWWGWSSARQGMLKVIHTPLLPSHTTHSSLLLAPLVTHTHARVIKEWETRTEPRNLGMKTDKRIIIRKAVKETLETILQTGNANDSRLMLQRRETLSHPLKWWLGEAGIMR